MTDKDTDNVRSFPKSDMSGVLEKSNVYKKVTGREGELPAKSSFKVSVMVLAGMLESEEVTNQEIIEQVREVVKDMGIYILAKKE